MAARQTNAGCGAGYESLVSGFRLAGAVDAGADGRRPAVYGESAQTSNFFYVRVEIGGIVALSNGSEYQPNNIGDPAEFTILECGQVLLEVARSGRKIRFEPLVCISMRAPFFVEWAHLLLFHYTSRIIVQVQS